MCLVTPDTGSGSGSTASPSGPGGCGHGKRCQHIHWPVRKFDLTLSVSLLVAFNVLTSITACHLPLYQCSLYLLPSERSFFQFP